MYKIKILFLLIVLVLFTALVNANEVINARFGIIDDDNLEIISYEVTDYTNIYAEEEIFNVINSSGSDLGEAIYTGDLFYEKDNLALFLGQVTWGGLDLNGACYSNLPSSEFECLYVRNNEEGENITFYSLRQNMSIFGTKTLVVMGLDIIEGSVNTFKNDFNVLENSINIADMEVEGSIINDDIFIGEFLVENTDGDNGIYFGFCFIGDDLNCYVTFKQEIIEEIEDTPTNPPSSTGGGSSNNPASTETCFESWYCDEWSACNNGIKTRNCQDLNECGTEEFKLIEEIQCQVTPIGSQGSIEESNTEEGTSNEVTGAVIGAGDFNIAENLLSILGIIVIIGIVISLFYIRKKYKK